MLGVEVLDNAEIHVSREIQLLSPPDAITMATIFKAAWSCVLANITKGKDLVFDQLVSGRSLPLGGVEEIIGSCVYIILVRITTWDE